MQINIYNYFTTFITLKPLPLVLIIKVTNSKPLVLNKIRPRKYIGLAFPVVT